MTTMTAIDPATLATLLDLHYAGEWSPVRDYLLDLLPEGSPDYRLTESGVWSGTLAEWLEVGPGVVQRVPLVRAELTDRKPHVGRRYAWWGYSFKLPDIDHENSPWRIKDGLPQEFFAEKRHPSTWHNYDTEELALADASRRAIAWARRTEVTP